MEEKQTLKDSIALAGFDADSEGSDGEISTKNQTHNSQLLNTTLPQVSSTITGNISVTPTGNYSNTAKGSSLFKFQQEHQDHHSFNRNSFRKAINNTNKMLTDNYTNINSNNNNDDDDSNKNDYIQDNNGNLEISILTRTSSPNHDKTATLERAENEITTITPPSQRISVSSNSLNHSSSSNTNNKISCNNKPFNSATAHTVIKRPKKIDISKFNRSNRKSKNCAIFYFKHLDTDNEQNKEFSESDVSHHDSRKYGSTVLKTQN